MRHRPVELGKAVELYLKSDKMSKAADNTRMNHRRTLTILIRRCGASLAITQLSVEDFDGVIDDLRRPAGPQEAAERAVTGRLTRVGRDEVSLNIDRAALRMFVKWLHKAELLPRTQDPSAGLENATRTRREGTKRTPLARSSAAALLEVAGRSHGRERIAVALALFGGLRESEIRRLTWGNVKWHVASGPILDFVRPKSGRGQSAHRIAINPALEAELRRWHTWYSTQHPEMRSSWFITPAKQRGKISGVMQISAPMNPTWPIIPDRQTWSLRASVKPLLATVGVTDLDGKGMHTLRRSFAVFLREDCGDIRAVQQALGHQSQLTTEVYMDFDREYEATSVIMRGWDPLAVVSQKLPDNVRTLRPAG